MPAIRKSSAAVLAALMLFSAVSCSDKGEDGGVATAETSAVKTTAEGTYAAETDAVTTEEQSVVTTSERNNEIDLTYESEHPALIRGLEAAEYLAILTEGFDYGENITGLAAALASMYCEKGKITSGTVEDGGTEKMLYKYSVPLNEIRNFAEAFASASLATGDTYSATMQNGDKYTFTVGEENLDVSVISAGNCLAIENHTAGVKSFYRWEDSEGKTVYCLEAYNADLILPAEPESGDEGVDWFYGEEYSEWYSTTGIITFVFTLSDDMIHAVSFSVSPL